MPGCYLCGYQSDDEDEFFRCQDCGETYCFNCGDGDMCYTCLGDEVFMDVIE